MKIEHESLGQSPLPHAIVSRDGVILSVNQAWTDFFMMRAKGTVSQPLYRLVDPADRTRFLSAWETLGSGDATVSQELRPASGGHHSGTMTWLFRSRAGTDELIATIVVHESDSPVQTNLEPPDSRTFDAELLAALDDLGNGLAMFENQQIVWVSDAMLRIFGYSREELIGTDGLQLVADHERAFVMKRRRARLSGDDPEHHYEFDGRRKDGSIVRLEMSVHTRGEDRSTAVCVVRDVTEQKNRGARRQREERLRSMGELAATLGREYNNMVMTYTLLTDALRDRQSADGPAPHELDRLDQLNRRALTLTRRLITLEGRPLSQPAPVDANITAWEAIERCDHLGVDIVPRLTPGLPHVTLDRDQLEVVLVELIENAAAASHEGGIVLVETAERVVSQHDELDHILDEGRYLVLRVVDDGDGISDEVLEHVVEPFFTTRPLEGMGLGLSTAYAIVRGLGGHLAIHSRDRVGTRIEVFLPVAMPSGDRPLSQPRLRRMLPDETHVILVDSSPVLRELLANELSKAGHEVTALSSPGEAFAAIQSGNPCDVIVAELVSVGGDAFDFVRRLRGEQLDICVVLTSGKQPLPDAPLDGEIPNLGFLHKPFTAERLALEIRSVLETRENVV